MNLLLLSSSRANNSDYMTPNLSWLKQHLAEVSSVLFIPYAGVTLSYDDYLQKVVDALQTVPVKITSIHQYPDAKAAVANCEAIMVGGGNTFQLLNILYEKDIIANIRKRVTEGAPYVGWSAGANIAGDSIRTTNDMPIVEPPSFDGLRLLAAQLNPHYTDYVPEGFHGETRDMRLAEFMCLNPNMPIIGLPEGSALQCNQGKLRVMGSAGAYHFVAGQKTPLPADSLVVL